MTNNEKEPKKEKSRMDILEETVTRLIDLVEGMAKKVDELEKTTGKKKGGLFGGKRERMAIKDTTTGAIYPSKASCAKAVAASVGEDPGDSFAWYKIIAKEPERFVEASEEERVKVEAELEAEREKERQEAQARLDTEKAAKKAAK